MAFDCYRLIAVFDYCRLIVIFDLSSICYGMVFFVVLLRCFIFVDNSDR